MTIKQNTNLASEFYIASCIMRLGLTCTITLGHTKEVDLVVANEKGNTVTVDVKGLKNSTNWPLTNPLRRRSHFYVFVTYRNKIGDITVSPEVYVVPSTSIIRLLSPWAGRPSLTCVPYSLLRTKVKYRNAWHLIEKALA